MKGRKGRLKSRVQGKQHGRVCSHGDHTEKEPCIDPTHSLCRGIDDMWAHDKFEELVDIDEPVMDDTEPIDGANTEPVNVAPVDVAPVDVANTAADVANTEPVAAE